MKYIIYSIVVGKLRYVGSTSNYRQRISLHVHSAKYLQTKLYKAMRDNPYEFQILKEIECESRVEARKLEEQFRIVFDAELNIIKAFVECSHGCSQPSKCGKCVKSTGRCKEHNCLIDQCAKLPCARTASSVCGHIVNGELQYKRRSSCRICSPALCLYCLKKYSHNSIHRHEKNCRKKMGYPANIRHEELVALCAPTA
jgi:hypothetical protein